MPKKEMSVNLKLLYRVCIELIALVLFALIVYLTIKQYPRQPFEDLLPKEEYECQKYKSGDLIISFGNYLDSIHPGHLSLVVQAPPYQQLYAWDLDSQEQTYMLKPLMPFLHSCYNSNKRVFVKHINCEIPELLQHIIRYSDIKYEFHGILQYCNFLLHRYLHLPGLAAPKIDSTNKRYFFYCSEVILRVLIDANVISTDIFYNLPELDHSNTNSHFHLFYPKFLLYPDFQLQEFLLNSYKYSEAYAITFISTN